MSSSLTSYSNSRAQNIGYPLPAAGAPSDTRPLPNPSGSDKTSVTQHPSSTVPTFFEALLLGMGGSCSVLHPWCISFDLELGFWVAGFPVFAPHSGFMVG
uniref:Uncharacterized protein n=1 Tax=Opuntia streptacantha TaxID=393608 RepID=A0A7C8Z4J2_OPUST